MKRWVFFGGFSLLGWQYLIKFLYDHRPRVQPTRCLKVSSMWDPWHPFVLWHLTRTSVQSLWGWPLLDLSKEHKVVQFEWRGSTPKCSKQSTKLCELHCEQCNIPKCNIYICVSSGEHLGHEQVDTTFKSLETKKDILNKDWQKIYSS